MIHNFPSQTAQAVAADLLLVARDPVFGRLVPPAAVLPTRILLQAASGVTGKIHYLVKKSQAYAGRWFTGKPALPGISIHNAIRKCWIEDQVRNALLSGYSQVVILGAGLDTLALRLHHEFPYVNWWEVDHPATQQIKRLVFVKHGGVESNLNLVPVDFSKNAAPNIFKFLRDYDCKLATILIAEGLLEYLPEHKVRELLAAMCANTAPNSCLIGTALAPLSDGKLALRGTGWLNNLKLRLIGEPLQWGIPLTEIAAFLNQNGFKFKEFVTTENLMRKYWPDINIKWRFPGEFIFRAKR